MMTEKDLELNLINLGLDTQTIEVLMDKVKSLQDQSYDNGYKDGAYSTEARNYWLEKQLTNNKYSSIFRGTGVF